jgi:hypothetical protein
VRRRTLDPAPSGRTRRPLGPSARPRRSLEPEPPDDARDAARVQRKPLPPPSGDSLNEDVAVLARARVMELLDYDSGTGTLRWRETRGSVARGGLAGWADKDGRRQVKVEGHLYYATTLIWLMKTGHWPEGKIDHRDRNPSNDRWSNLRLATNAQNTQNSTVSLGASGLRGVSRDGNKWRARITANGRQIWLGNYDTPEAAAAVYEVAANLYFGEFAAYNTADNIKRDAQRWRALLASARIRTLTTIPQPYSRPPPGTRYLCIEFWSDSAVEERWLSSPQLIDYADFMVKKIKQ